MFYIQAFKDMHDIYNLMAQHSEDIKVGKMLPPWSLSTIFGDKIPDPDVLKGKPLLILIFHLGCRGCMGRAVPFANRMVYENGDRMHVMGIHTFSPGIQYTIEEFEEARESFYIRFPFFMDDTKRTTYQRYEALGTPHWVLTDENLIVRYVIFGSDPNNALLRLDYKIRELLERDEDRTDQEKESGR